MLDSQPKNTSQPSGSLASKKAIYIEGIGPKYAAILSGSGIHTVADLQSMDIVEINGSSDIPGKLLWKWQAAAVLLQIPGLDNQLVEALVAAGFRDVQSVAQADPIDLYHAIEMARNPREAKNMIPDTYQRVITPHSARVLQSRAYELCSQAKGAPPSPYPVHVSLAPYSEWIPADEANYGPNPNNRWIEHIVIHAMASSMGSAINTFQNPTSKVSAHYLVGQSGRLVQMVREGDVAFHAANSGCGCRGGSASSCSGYRSGGESWSTGPCNCHSIGIELEDLGQYKYSNNWVTAAMYQTLADLVRSLCNKYGIPKKFVGYKTDRSGILGHQHVENRTPGKDDPGSGFDWNHFMDLVDPYVPPQPPPDEYDDGGDDGNGGKGK
jgi:N-acetyl-anhydromuramyl-L-alanine amidase AmpD